MLLTGVARIAKRVACEGMRILYRYRVRARSHNLIKKRLVSVG